MLVEPADIGERSVAAVGHSFVALLLFGPVGQMEARAIGGTPLLQASGARLAVIVGDDEADSDTVAIKTLRDGGDQVSVPVQDLPARFAAMNISKDEYGCL